MKAKLNSGQLEYFKQPAWLLGDATAYAIEQGYKDVVYPEISEMQYLGSPIEMDEVITFEVVDKTEEQLMAERIHEKISARQLRSALILKGIQLSTIDAVISQLPEPQKSLVKVDWEYSTNFYRHNSMINQLAGAMQLSAEQVDEIFILGASLIND